MPFHTKTGDKENKTKQHIKNKTEQTIKNPIKPTKKKKKK